MIEFDMIIFDNALVIFKNKEKYFVYSRDYNSIKDIVEFYDIDSKHTYDLTGFTF